MLIAERMQRLGTENAFRLGVNIQECIDRGDDVIRFNLGEPDFDTPAVICEEATRQLQAGNTHYCPPEGLLSLRQAIAQQVSASRGLNIDPQCVIITTGGKPPISFTLMTYVNPGDEVIYPSPGFPIYESWIRYVGGVPIPLHLRDAKDFRFDAEELDTLITARTRVIFINSPSNPTGGVLQEDDLRSIAALIHERCSPDVRIYSDEIYEQIIFDGHRHRSIASCAGMEKRTIIASGHSKSFAMTGWRLGFAILPTVEEAQHFKNFNINITSCTPPFIQEAGRVAYQHPAVGEAVVEMVKKFQQRRNFAVPALNLIPGIQCAMPQGAFYLFPNIEGVCKNLGILEAWESLPVATRGLTNPSRLLQMFLLYKYGVATLDRNSFGSVGVEDCHFLRLSSATGMDNLRDGIQRLAAASTDEAGFRDFFESGLNLY